MLPLIKRMVTILAISTTLFIGFLGFYAPHNNGVMLQTVYADEYIVNQTVRISTEEVTSTPFPAGSQSTVEPEITLQENNHSIVRPEKEKRVKETVTIDESLPESAIPLCPCGVLKSPPSSQDEQYFQAIDDEFLVHSAYYDDRRTLPVVVAFGVGTRESINKVDIRCILWYNTSHCDIVNAHVQQIGVRPVRNPSTSFTCPSLRKGFIPRYVTYTSSMPSCSENTAVVHIANREKSPSKNNLTVCVHGALIKNISNDDLLVEFIEVYSILGANKFAIYNHTGASNLKHAMDYYRERDVLDTITWTMPEDFLSENAAQASVVDDCIYRYMYQTKYVLLINLDEFVLPRRHDNLVDMIENGACSGAREFVFRNTFFHCGFPNDELVTSNETLVHLRSFLLARTMRDDFIMTNRSRTKFLIRPNQFLRGGTHRAGSAIKGSGISCIVPPGEALLQHYKCRAAAMYVPMIGHLVNSTIDRTAYRFFDKIVDRLTFARNHVQRSLAIHV